MNLTTGNDWYAPFGYDKQQNLHKLFFVYY